MGIFGILIIGLSLGIDSFAVAISIGAQMKAIKLYNGFKVGSCFGIFQFSMSVMGYLTYKFISPQILKYGHWISFILLTAIGINMLLESYKKLNYKTVSLDLDTKNLITLGFATSIDAFAVGITLYDVKIDILLATLIIGIIAFFMSLAGIFLGSKFEDTFSDKGEKLGSAILIFMGIKELLGHFQT